MTDRLRIRAMAERLRLRSRDPAKRLRARAWFRRLDRILHPRAGAEGEVLSGMADSLSRMADFRLKIEQEFLSRHPGLLERHRSGAEPGHEGMPSACELCGRISRGGLMG